MILSDNLLVFRRLGAKNESLGKVFPAFKKNEDLAWHVL